MLKLIITLTALHLISAACCAQQAKPFIPAKGEIIFEQREIVGDSDSLQFSVNKMLDEAYNVAEQERAIDGIETTIEEKETALSMARAGLTGAMSGSKPVRLHHVFKHKVIVGYTTMDNNIIGDYTIIDTQAATTTMLAKKDSSFAYMPNRPYEYTAFTNVEIKEYRNETKTIGGYTCFRVRYAYRENDEYLAQFQAVKELWVTEAINSLYHPVIREKEILQKYYPLEITESTDVFKGHKTIYRLVSVSVW